MRHMTCLVSTSLQGVNPSPRAADREKRAHLTKPRVGSPVRTPSWTKSQRGRADATGSDGRERDPYTEDVTQGLGGPR